MQAEPLGEHPHLRETEPDAVPRRIDRITMNTHVPLPGLDSALLSLETPSTLALVSLAELVAVSLAELVAPQNTGWMGLPNHGLARSGRAEPKD
jgi:hypothetical protein